MVKGGRVLVLILLASMCAALTGAAEENLQTRRNVKQEDSNRSSRARCVSCSVNGQLYEGHSRFQYEEGCFRYRCVCRCNGSWECPAQYTENICGNSDITNGASRSQSSSSSHVSSSSSSSSVSSSVSQRSGGRCRSCVVNGKEQQGNSYFTHVEGCVTFDNCICYCNGSWVCPSERARNTCADGDGKLQSSSSVKTATRTVEIEKSGSSASCTSCSESGSASSSSSSGSSFVSNGSSNTRIGSSSSHSETRVSESSSSTNGSGRGSSSSVVNSRQQDTRRTGDRRQSHRECHNCTVSGKAFKGNTYFDLEDGCRKMKYCRCYCNGSWNCPDRFVENTCGPDQTDTSSQQTSNCRYCSVKGRTFPGNRNFEITDGCVEYKNCVCNCDGSWNCPDSGARNICNQGAVPGSSCRECQVKGRVFPGNEYFQLTDGCVEYKNCICNCDGSWNCPDSGASNICNQGAVPGSSCRECQVKGRVFPGNEYFQLTDGCVEYKNCICNCDGSWNCPDSGARNICNQGAVPGSSCRECQVKGRVFPGNQYFQLTDGCVEFKNCICNCDGSWNCPDSGARNICNQGATNRNDLVPRSSCSQCRVKDQVFQGNEYFTFSDVCIEYKNCFCNCNGSWSCPDDSATNKCQERKVDTSDTTTCAKCEVYGATFVGNQYFQFSRGCIEYRNCICHCNGTWNCPSESAVNTCDSRAKSSSDVTDTSRTSISDCLSCSAYGKTFKGGDYFDVIDGCTSYRNCICRCNGSWHCNNRFATNVCRNETRGSTDNRGSYVERTDYRNTNRTSSSSSSSSTDGKCSYCNAKNKIVRGNSYFEITDGCIEYKNCLCKCDGSWECPSQFAKNICIGSEQNSGSTGISPTTCNSCVAKGKIVKGNSYFELIDGCTRYISCRCNCDGKWECPEERAQNICFTNTTVSESGCSLCQASDGVVHQPNSRFKLTEDCTEYTCDCFCNGSWKCPGKNSRWVCQDRCLQCDVEGRKVQNNTQFFHKTGCLEYTCNCHCNGSWSCPGNTVRNTCPAGVRDGCNKCTVSPTEVYEGESDFVLQKGCIQYKCRCNCDGGYSCPGKDARNVCRGEVLGGCRSCVVSESEIHKGETEFTMRKDCIQFQCTCNCDGNWECPREKAINVCLGEVPGGCRACRVSETEVYRANSVFDMRKDCIHYKCTCNCDGSWSCPGEDARDVCKGEIPGGCRSCIVSDEFYPGNSNFEMVKNCIHYKCRCNCNGSYICPSQTARRVCQSGVVAEAPTCRSCRISEAEHFTGNTTFYLERGCTRYECECRCDSSWQCPAGKSKNICARDSPVQINPDSCNTCKISKEVYPGNTAFKYTRGCSQFDCKCECSGRWSCDYKNRVDICRGEQSTTEQPLISDSSAVRHRQDFSSSDQAATEAAQRGSSYFETDIQSHEVYSSNGQYSSGTKSSGNTQSSSSSGDNISNCRPCNADGRTIQPNEVFTLDRGCVQYKNCRCSCDGRWQCSEESNRCDTAQSPVVPQGERSHRTETQSSSSTSTGRRTVDSSGWVFVDGVNSTLKTSEGQTGGGYVVQIDTGNSPRYITRGQTRLEQLETYPSSSRTNTGSSYSSSTFLSSGSSPDTSLTSSTSDDNKGTNQCLRCQVDSKTYPSGANFDMRRGCVVYKCLCLCSGSYRCRLTSDNECSLQDKQNTCSNCLYQGMVFPGNMGFTVREGCEEKQCNCNCDGTHVCHSTKQIPECTDVTANGPGLPGFGNFYPAPGGLFPGGRGYITNRVVSTCTTCLDPGDGLGLYPVPVVPGFGNGGGGFVSTEHRVNVDQSRSRDTCSGCFIDGQARGGNSTFTFKKDCIEFDCYCACGGSWKCAGRLAVDCATGFVPETVPHTPGCRSCNVQGTVYPANAKFSLRQGCHEYQCSCNCDGGWSCPNQHPVNLCPSAPNRPVRGHVMDPQIVRDDTYVADQGMSNNNDGKQGDHMRVSHSTDLKTVVDTCFECEVRGVTYQARSKFFLREGCIQRICECHCNKSWSCLDTTVDICQIAASEDSNVNSGQCRECRVGSDVYVSENDFQINNDCFQHNCYCYCNGTHVCPTDRVRNICNPNPNAAAREHATNNGRQSNVRIQQTFVSKDTGEVTAVGKVHGCKECLVDGEKIEALAAFVKQLGCYESLCHCQCNGQASCPPSASVNVCELPDKLPMNERKGCQVGRRTHLTRVFAHIENCIQRTCVCHDNGEWTCKRTANDIKVC